MANDDGAGGDNVAGGGNHTGDRAGDHTDPAWPAPTPPGRPAGDVRRDVSGPGDAEGAAVIVGVSFEQPLRAEEYLLAMRRLRAEGALDLQDAVVVRKDDRGRTHVTETIDPTPGRSALSGAMWTGLLGLIVGGPVGWLAGLGVGAGAGAVAAKVVDLGIPDEWVDWFEEVVAPGTATVVILAEDLDVVALEAEARRFPGAELVYTTLPPAIYDELADAFGG